MKKMNTAKYSVIEFRHFFTLWAVRVAKHYEIKKYLTKRFVKAFRRKEKVYKHSYKKAEIRHYFTKAFVQIFKKYEKKYRQSHKRMMVRKLVTKRFVDTFRWMYKKKHNKSIALPDYDPLKSFLAESKRDEVRHCVTKFVIQNYLLKNGQMPKIAAYLNKIKRNKKSLVFHMVGLWATKVFRRDILPQYQKALIKYQFTRFCTLIYQRNKKAWAMLKKNPKMSEKAKNLESMIAGYFVKTFYENPSIAKVAQLNI